MGVAEGLLVILIGMGVLALLLRPMGPTEHFIDKDADGEPDEPDGPAAGL